ncbi:MAG: PAS domain-containing protein [Chloroflexi bacterium]|nr:PAS domain-containing protein [Chloroflexota bacterium]
METEYKTVIATQLEAEITRLRLEQTKLQTLLDVSRALNIARTPDDVLKLIIQTAVASGATGAYLLYIDLNPSGEPEWAEIVASWVRDEDFGAMPPGFRIQLADFPFNRLWLANPNETQFIPDVAQAEMIDDNLRPMLVGFGTQALIVVPLTQGGRWVGLMGIGWPEPHSFSDLEVALYQAVPALAAPVVENLRVVANQEHVIEQRTAEMRETRNMLQTVLDTIPVRVFWKDTESRFLGCNRLFAQDMGCTSPDELIGKSDYDFASADRAESYRADDQAVRETRQARLNIEEQLTRGDGSTLWLRTSKVPLLDRAGQCIGTLGAGDRSAEAGAGGTVYPHHPHHGSHHRHAAHRRD